MTEAQCVRLAVQALLEVVDSGAKTMELCVVRSGGIKHVMDEQAVDAVVKEIEAEQQEGQQATPTTAAAAVTAGGGGDS
jgi:20S proteasome subunit alpha 4